MWYPTFEQRLASWNQLRQSTASLPLETALKTINNWWQQTPWRAYHLHWDDQPEWPNPWQLLSDNIYCDLARGLGILYTITLIDRPDCQDCILTEVDQCNLVLIDSGKYILNWDQDIGVNINLNKSNSRRQIRQADLKLQLY